ncbi:MAG: hypothetical protein ABI411_05965 [Tahibacter sp.]
MSNVVAFLEKMGQDARLRHASKGETELALLQGQIDPLVRAAILSKDQRQLEALLGANTNVCCALAPADDEQSPAREEEEIVADNRRSGLAR